MYKCTTLYTISYHFKSNIPKISKVYVHVYCFVSPNFFSGHFFTKKENTLNIIVIIGLTNNLMTFMIMIQIALLNAL